jgi:hypothetical protein
MPSQVPAVSRLDGPEQFEGTHTVSAGYKAHAPNPSHTPFVPQDSIGCAVHLG